MQTDHFGTVRDEVMAGRVEAVVIEIERIGGGERSCGLLPLYIESLRGMLQALRRQ
jgi:hypothetical protein